MKTKLFYLCMLAAIILSGCKGDDGAAGPAGAAGANGAFTLSSGGSVTGTINGFQSDGTPITNMPFDYKYYYDVDNFHFNGLEYSFQLNRYPSSNPLAEGYCEVDFNLSSLTSTTPTAFNLYGSFLKDLGSNRKFNFRIYSLSNSTVIVTGFSYNTTTHVATGTFAINVDATDNTTGFPATVSGTFTSNAMTEYVYRKGN